MRPRIVVSTFAANGGVKRREIGRKDAIVVLVGRLRRGVGWTNVAGLLGAFLLLSGDARATLSILGVDTDTGEIGAAVVSCVEGQFDLAEVVRIDDEVGGIVAQSYFSKEGRDELLRLLRAGESPESALALVTSPAFDPASENDGATYRQYGVVLLDGSSATYTGTNAEPQAESRTVTLPPYSLTVQGNLMAEASSLEVLARGFEETSGDLGRRLTGALGALGEHGSGDVRCAPRTSDAAHFELHSSRLESPVVVSILKASGDAALELAEQGNEELERELPPVPSPRPVGNSGCQWRNAPTPPDVPGFLLVALFAACRPARCPRGCFKD